MISRRIRVTSVTLLLIVPLVIVLLRLTMFGYSWSAIEPSRTYDVQTGWVDESLRGGSRIEIELVSPSGTTLERPVVVASGTINTERVDPQHIRVSILLDQLGGKHHVTLSFRAIVSPDADGGRVNGSFEWIVLDSGRLRYAGDVDSGYPEVGLSIAINGRNQTITTPLSGSVSRIDISQGLVLRAFDKIPMWNAYQLWVSLERVGVPFTLITLLLVLPLGALLVVLARNILGFETYGTFLPALIAASSIQVGLDGTIATFLLVTIVVAAGHPLLSRVGLLYAPRMAILLTVVIGLLLGMAAFGELSGWHAAMAAPLLPVVLVTMTAERFAKQWEEDGPLEALRIMGMTLVIVLGCHLIMSQPQVQVALLAFPELLISLIPLHILLGRWVGLRLTEWGRFRILLDRRLPQRRAETVLGMNRRNAELIDKENAPRDRRIVDDKLWTKELLIDKGISVPPTIDVYSEIGDLKAGMKRLENTERFAIKPASGRAGGGILILERAEGGWSTPSGRLITPETLRHHLAGLLHGPSARGTWDRVIVEHRVEPSVFCQEVSNCGLPDVRVIVWKGEILMAMMRIPTLKSDGKANLHQGALGVGIDLETGRLGLAFDGVKWHRYHPDSGARISGRMLPDWEKTCKLATDSAEIVPLGYLGVDIVFDAELGPVVMELNARPGLMVQVVNRIGLRSLMKLGSDSKPDKDTDTTSPRTGSFFADLGRIAISLIMLMVGASLLGVSSSSAQKWDLETTFTYGRSYETNVFQSPDMLLGLSPDSLVRSDLQSRYELDVDIDRKSKSWRVGIRGRGKYEVYDEFSSLNAHDLRAMGMLGWKRGRFSWKSVGTLRDRKYSGSDILGDALLRTFDFREREVDTKVEIGMLELRGEWTLRSHDASASEFDLTDLRFGAKLSGDRLSLDIEMRDRSYARDKPDSIQRDIRWISVDGGVIVLDTKTSKLKTEVGVTRRKDMPTGEFSYWLFSASADMRLELPGPLEARGRVSVRHKTFENRNDLQYTYADFLARVTWSVTRKAQIEIWTRHRERTSSQDLYEQAFRRSYLTRTAGVNLILEFGN